MDAADAGKAYREALDASREQRRQIEEDLKFSDPSCPDQWDDEEKRERENNPGGARPCLVMDQLGQYVANVTGQLEQRPPALHALPVDSSADIKVAERLDGWFRHIEHASKAQQHYLRAGSSMARAGVGYLILRPEVTDRALNYQEPRISSEGDPLRVVFDPWSVELDGSDANFGFLTSPLSHQEFERRFGKKHDKVSFGADVGEVVHDERQSITIAEGWMVEEKRENLIVAGLPNGDQATYKEDEFHEARQKDPRIVYLRNYTGKYRCVKWGLWSGAEALQEEVEYPANSVGIVPMYGYVSFVGGRMKFCGMARRAREPQRDYNYHASEIRALMQKAPRSPWMMPLRGIPEGQIKNMWDAANVEDRAYLVYKDFDPETQQAIAPPSRTPNGVNLAHHMAGLDAAARNIQSSLGLYQANLGAPSNETSGVAIESRKQQGEASTAHFQSHVAASIAQIGRMALEMLPKHFDQKRYMRTIGFDETPGGVTIDPNLPQARVQMEDGTELINPNVGKYDVRIVVGASFSTQRQQAQMAFTEMVRANPGILPAVGPLWAKTMDVPNADKLAQVLTAIAPPEVRAVLQPEKQAPTEQMMAENERLKQALQEATQIAEEMQAELQEAQAKNQDKAAEIEVKEDQVAIQAFDAVTKRLQVIRAEGGPVTPEVIAQTMQQVLAQSQPTQEVEPMPDPTQTLGPMVQGMGEQMNAQIQQLAAAQAQQAQALSQLIRLVQAPRERIPERGADGAIQRVLDRIVLEQAEPEGPMQ